MKNVAFLLTGLFGVLPATALMPGVMLSVGHIEPDLGDRSRSFSQVGVSLSERIGYLEPFGDLNFGRMRADASERHDDPLFTASLGARFLLPIRGGFEAGALGGYQLQGYKREEARGTAIERKFGYGPQPFVGASVGFQGALYIECGFFPQASTHIPWTVRIGLQPLAF